jgi:hypothetical protein
MSPSQSSLLLLNVPVTEPLCCYWMSPSQSSLLLLNVPVTEPLCCYWMSPSQSLSVAIECPRHRASLLLFNVPVRASLLLLNVPVRRTDHTKKYFSLFISRTLNTKHTKKKALLLPGYPPFQPHFFTSQYQTYKIQRTKKKTLLLPGFPPPPFSLIFTSQYQTYRIQRTKIKTLLLPGFPPPLLASSSPHNPIPILRTDFLSIVWDDIHTVVFSVLTF